jgi:quinol-cytochrome oxidoreductase complex cytochrome b subunit
MHPYFNFKDLVTVFLFFLALTIIVCYYPNLLGQMWPNINVLIVYLIYVCAISWKYKLNNYLVKIYNKTILVSDLLIDNLFVFVVLR